MTFWCVESCTQNLFHSLNILNVFFLHKNSQLLFFSSKLVGLERKLDVIYIVKKHLFKMTFMQEKKNKTGTKMLTWNREARSWNPSGLLPVILKNTLICMADICTSLHTKHKISNQKRFQYLSIIKRRIITYFARWE